MATTMRAIASNGHQGRKFFIARATEGADRVRQLASVRDNARHNRLAAAWTDDAIVTRRALAPSSVDGRLPTRSAFLPELGYSKARVGHLVIPATLALVVFASPVSGQERPWVVFGTGGVADIGHADSEQGHAPVVAGGAAFRIVPWLLLEAEVHGARVRHVFGREHHGFSERTLTGSLLFRAFPQRGWHFVGGAGLAVQRAHIEFDVSPVGHVDRSETLRLVHGRAGVEWDMSPRVLIRSEAVLWLGAGLDWVLGGRVGVGYRF